MFCRFLSHRIKAQRTASIAQLCEGGNERAALALKMFVRRVVKYIGSYFVLLNGPEALVFTGGISEYSHEIRKLVLQELASLNIKLDEDANNTFRGKKGVISTADSAWKAIVMPTNEELMIAKSTKNVLGLD